MTTITTVTRGKRIGVSRDGKAIGYAVRIPKAGTWTAYVYTTAPPFDYARPGFATSDDAVAYITAHGRNRS
jgi:hypothetical protein